MNKKKKGSEKMEVKKIEVNENYHVVIKYHLDNYYIRLYQLIDNEDRVICESYNRDSFLLKCRNYVKINSNLENVIASV